MKNITLIIFVTIIFVNHVFGQSEQAKPNIATPKEVATEMKKFAPFIGTFKTTSKLFNQKTGELISEDKGTIICQLRALGNVFSIEKDAVKPNGRIYDDIMVFQYDAVKRKVIAILFSPDAVPRNIEVEIKGNVMTLIYEPYLNGDITRETVTANGQNAEWLIERKQADGSFRKTREISATPKTIGKFNEGF